MYKEQKLSRPESESEKQSPLSPNIHRSCPPIASSEPLSGVAWCWVFLSFWQAIPHTCLEFRDTSGKSPFPPKPVKLFKETLTVIWLTKGGGMDPGPRTGPAISRQVMKGCPHASPWSVRDLSLVFLVWCLQLTGVCYSLPNLEVYGLTPELWSVPIITSWSALQCECDMIKLWLPFMWAILAALKGIYQHLGLPWLPS